MSPTVPKVEGVASSKSRVTMDRETMESAFRLPPSRTTPPTKPPTSLTLPRWSLVMALYSSMVSFVVFGLPSLATNFSQVVLRLGHSVELRDEPVDIVYSCMLQDE